MASTEDIEAQVDKLVEADDLRRLYDLEDELWFEWSKEKNPGCKETKRARLDYAAEGISKVTKSRKESV